MSAPPRRRLVGIIGLLLTPLVAWAVSFLGGWVGALIGEGVASDSLALWTMVTGSVVFGAGAAILWIRLLLRYRTPGMRQEPEE